MSFMVQGMSMPIYSGQYKARDKWPVKPSFVEPLQKNVNSAIKHYLQKYQNFMNIMNGQFLMQLNSLNIDSIETLFEKAAANYEKNVSGVWQSIQKTSTANLAPLLQELSVQSQQLSEAGEGYISFYQILQTLSNNALNDISPTTIPGFVSIKSFQGYLNKFLNTASNNTRSRGGSRARIIGAIYEEGVSSFMWRHVEQLLDYIPIGGKNKKEDAMYVGPNESFKLQGSELFDLEKETKLQKVIQEYANTRSFSVQLKGWIGSTGTFGKSSKTASLINQRAEKVSKWFSHFDQFQYYNAYIVSKYLLNIIGAQNAFIVTGAHGIQPTYNWLANLYNNGYMLRHVTQLAIDREGGTVYGHVTSDVRVRSQNPRGEF